MCHAVIACVCTVLVKANKLRGLYKINLKILQLDVVEAREVQTAGTSRESRVPLGRSERALPSSEPPAASRTPAHAIPRRPAKRPRLAQTGVGRLHAPSWRWGIFTLSPGMLPALLQPGDLGREVAGRCAMALHGPGETLQCVPKTAPLSYCNKLYELYMY